MRIISGRYKGKRIGLPGGVDIRPTTDQAREGLFNILQHRWVLEDTRVLDLFAGSGAVSLEFLSRDCREVVAVEQSPKAVARLRQTIRDWEVENMLVLQKDVFLYLRQVQDHFDIIFADPPFAHPRLEELPDEVLASGLLKEDGLLILEHSKTHSFEGHPLLMETRRYGHVHFSFFHRQAGT